MLNALTMMAAQDRGGTFGVLVDPKGFLLESCVLNAVIITESGMLLTPTFERALAGTTVRRVMELAKRSLVGSLLKDVKQERVKLEDVRKAKEIFLCAGDTHLYAITQFDGKQVGDGRIGPVFTAVHKMLLHDAAHGSEHHQPILSLA